MSDLIIRQAMALKLKSDSSLSLDQAKTTAKQAQARSYTTKRKGYIKALPMSVLTPKAKDSVWAEMQRGTDASYKRNVCKLDAKHKSSTMPDPVTMSELNRKIALERPNDNAIKLAVSAHWLLLFENTLTAKQRRTLRFLIDQNYQDGAEMLIEQAGGNLTVFKAWRIDQANK